MLRVRGYDPPHFDPHLTLNFKTNTTLSFVHSKLVRHRVGAGVPPGTFAVEPDLAERWEEPDDTTVVFYLRRGVRWHNKPPVNGRELTAEDVKVSYDRFLTEKGNPLEFMLDPVDRVEVVDRYTVRFRLKEPFVWLVNMLANPTGTWIVARELVEKYGDLKRPESAIGTGPFVLERYEPNVKTVFRRNPDYFRPGQPSVDGVEWLVLEDDSVGLATYRTGQIDCRRSLAPVGRPPAGLAPPQEECAPPGLPGLPGQRDHRPLHATDKPPFNDVRVRRAISLAVDRQAIIDAVFIKGEPSPAIARGVPEWSPRIDQSVRGAVLSTRRPGGAPPPAEAGFPNGLKTQINATPAMVGHAMPCSSSSASSRRAASTRRSSSRSTARTWRPRSTGNMKGWPWGRSASPGSPTAISTACTCPSRGAIRAT